VAGQIVDPDRLEGARPDVQGHVRAGHTGAPARLEQRLVEVQAGGRSRHGAGRARIDRLVALASVSSTGRCRYGGSGISP